MYCLRPVQEVVVAPSLGAGAHVQRVGAGLGLGHRVPADDVPRHQPGQVRLLLRRGAENDQRQLDAPHLRVEREEQPVVVAAVSQGLHDQGRREDVAAGATQFGRDGQALDPELGACLPRLARELARIVALRQILVEFPPGEVGRRLHQLALLGAQREVHSGLLVRIGFLRRALRRPWLALATGRPIRDTAAAAARHLPAGRRARRSAAACACASAWSVSGASGPKSW